MGRAEMWDITDAEGTPTGLLHERGTDSWPPGAYHVVAATCVVRPGRRVLLTRRSPEKDLPGTWEFPGGSALAGESSAQAAVRELHEETGLRVPEDSLRRVERFREERALFDLYVVAAPAGATLRLDQREVVEAEWVTLSEVDRWRQRGRFGAPWQTRLTAFWLPLLATVEDLVP